MTFDPMTWALALGGSTLLALGGALLRGGSGEDPADAKRRADAHEADLEEARAATAKAQAELGKLRTAIERQGYESHNEAEKLEKLADEAKAEAARAVEELRAEKTLAAQMEASLEEVRGALRAAQSETKSVEERVKVAEEQAKAAEERAKAAEERAKAAEEAAHKPAAPKAPTVDPATKAQLEQLKQRVDALTAERDTAKKQVVTMTGERDAARRELEAAKKAQPSADGDAAKKALAAELEAAKKQLAELTTERDAAREKSESLERLVDAVRARSRDLAAELKELKSKA